MVRRSIFDHLYHELQEIRYRLDDIERSFSNWNAAPLKISESELLSLPDHLRKTYIAVASNGECNATQVSNLTGRCRTIESSYLNQLVGTGWLAKRRDSKEIHFYVIVKKGLRDWKDDQQELNSEFTKPREQAQMTQNHAYKTGAQLISVKCLCTDYDGTISQLNVTREESRVPVETRTMLNQISRSLPVLVVTMKDLDFIKSRTPFAHAWSGIGGLETQLGKKVLRSRLVDSKLSSVSEACDYAKSHATIDGVEIEEKQDLEGHIIAFCVDWRQARDHDAVRKEADHIATYSKSLGLKVIKYRNQPFYDVYPVAPDKGKALREMLSEFSVNSGVMYLGDSETDNSAFRNSAVSIGVIHDETPQNNLECDYFLRFKDVPAFFNALIANKFQFSPDFPMVTTNFHRRKLASF